MKEGSFSEHLMRARIRRGLTEEQVSQTLRIMPSIVRALEDGDFAHLPHVGFTRNMVSSYARYLGLDSAAITEQFLREYREFERWQSGKAPNPVKRNTASHIPKTSGNDQGRRPVRSQGGSSKSMWDSRHPNELSKGFDSNSQQVQQQTMRNIRNHQNTKSLPARIFGAIFSKPIVIILLLLALLVAAIVGVALLANSCSASKPDPGVISVTGGVSTNTGEQATTDSTADDTAVMTDTTDSDAMSAEEAAKYGPFELTVSVKGGASWLEITVDGEKVVAQSAPAGYKKTFTVTKSAKVVAGAPSRVTVKRNDKTQKLKTANGVGSLTLKVATAPTTAAADDDSEATDSGTGGGSTQAVGSALIDNPSTTDIPSASDLTGR